MVRRPLMMAMVVAALLLVAACVGEEPTPTPTTPPTPDLPPLTPTTAGAPTVGDALQASADATIYEDETGSLANGSGPFLFVGANRQLEARRALIRFELAESVPPGATITAVRLGLSSSRTAGSSANVALHRVLGPWQEGPSGATDTGGRGASAQEGDPTWVFSRFDTQRWDEAGGDFAPEPSASTTIGGVGRYFWGSTPGMVADVQGWLDDPSSNRGWVLVGEEKRAQTAKRFDSREHEDEGNRPVLTVEFTVAQ